jgi:hypothetical protein
MLQTFEERHCVTLLVEEFEAIELDQYVTLGDL